MATITAAKFAEILGVIDKLSPAQAAMLADALHQQRPHKAPAEATYKINVWGLRGSSFHVRKFLDGKLSECGMDETQYTIWIPPIHQPKFAHVIVDDPTVFEELLHTLSERLKSTSITVKECKKKEQKRRAATAAVDDVGAAAAVDDVGAAAGGGFRRKPLPVPDDVPDDVQENVRALLAGGREISGAKFQAEYKKRYGTVIDYKGLGYRSLTHLLTTIVGVKSIAYAGDGPRPNTISLE